MRYINKIVVHCSASQPLAGINAETIKRWHTAAKPNGNGWSDIGYHYVIKTSGTLEFGRPLNTIGAHVSGHNSKSIGICLVGGVDKDGKSANNFTKEQFETLDLLLATLKKAFKDAEILGHRDFPNVKKDCPCFNVKEWLKKGVK